ncbi:MAG TPA: hypothetical protein VLH35_04660, partial [Candidatus Acidoferrales bacterium]|nr:hypothetical protein [Candidatus Acidoferrales bacterium]
LYIAIGLTLLSPTPAIFTLVEIGFPTFAIAAFVTRTASLAANYRHALLQQRTNLRHPKMQTT